MRRLSNSIPLLFLAGVLAASSTPFPISRARELAASLGKSVVNVQVVAPDERGRTVSMASFSGFVLADDRNLVVACCFNLPGVLSVTKGRLEVTYDDLRHGTGVLRGHDEKTGLCLIECRGNPNPPEGIKLGEFSRLVNGKPVLTVANPFGIQYSARYGVAVGPTSGGTDEECLAYRLSLDAVRGREGAVVCDFERKLAGVVLPFRGYLLPEEGGGRVDFTIKSLPPARVLPARALAVVVERLRKNQPVVRGWIGVTFTVSGGKGEGKVVRIAGVDRGSPAEAAGLEPGDTVLEADGKVLRSLTDLYYLALWVEYEGVERELLLKVERGGEKLAISVPVRRRPERTVRSGK